MRKKINKNLLFGFIAPYLVVVLIVFIAQYISNSVVLNALKSNALDIVQNSFENNVAVLEKNLERVKETAVIIAQNTTEDLESIRRDKNDFYTRLKNIKKELSDYFVDSAIIKDICVQNDRKDYLVNFSTAYSSRKGFYETMVSSESKSAEELLKASESANGFATESACIYADGVKAIPFAFPTPVMEERTGSVMVYVDKYAMLLPLRSLLENSKGTLKIFDSDGALVIKEGDKELDFTHKELSEKPARKSEGGKKYYLLTADGKASDWSYSIMLPEKYVLSGVRYYQLFSLAFNFLVLLVGFALCLFFTIKKSSLYLQILEMLGVAPEKLGIKSIVSGQEYDGLFHHISKIKDENMWLQEKGVQNLLRRILSGQIEKNEEIKKELRNHKIEFDGLCYGVIVIRQIGRDLPEENMKNFESFLMNEIHEIIPSAKICFTEKDVTAIVISCDEEYRAFAKDSMSRLEKELFSKYHIKVLSGISESVNELSMLSVSYKEAYEVIRYNLFMDGQKQYFYNDLPSEEDNYYFPIEIENALFKSVRENDFEKARECLRKIQEENFTKRNLGVNDISELLAELRASIRKICSLQTEYLEFSKEEWSVNHFFENAISFIYTMCTESVAESEALSRGSKLCKEIKNYIELHYNNKNLSLELIAEEFRIHPNYLSGLFKKHTGNNLAPFIESIRIEKAAELLSSGKYTVNEVAASVGFSNDATFRRRFKKTKGVPPSTYLKY